MNLIPYAGFDPGENDFIGINPAPLHERERRKRRNARSGRQAINVRRAAELKSQGLSWDRIGQILAAEDRREVSYLGCSVAGAVYRESGANAW